MEAHVKGLMVQMAEVAERHMHILKYWTLYFCFTTCQGGIHTLYSTTFIREHLCLWFMVTAAQAEVMQTSTEIYTMVMNIKDEVLTCPAR